MRQTASMSGSVVSLSQRGPLPWPQTALCLNPRAGCLIVSLSHQGGPSLALADLCLNPRAGCLIVSLSHQGVPSLALAALCLSPRSGYLSYSSWDARQVVPRPRIFFGASTKSCRGCNNEKPYDVQPTPGPGQGSRRKAHNSCLSETTVSAPFSSPGPMVS